MFVQICREICPVVVCLQISGARTSNGELRKKRDDVCLDNNKYGHNRKGVEEKTDMINSE